MLAPVAASMITAASLALIPKPVLLEIGNGSFTLNDKTHIAVGKGTETVARQLQGYLSPATGFAFDTTRIRGKNTIELKLDASLSKPLGTEGYRLSVNDDHILITGPTLAGIFYGCQTLRQLLPSAIFRKAGAQADWVVPAVEIEDYPRFMWRGAHLDVGRHFMPKETILKFIDLMAMHKINTFHWHLTEDQGWRIEIKKYPKLTEVGAWRKDDMLVYDPPKYSGKPHGGFYTQDDVREIVAYAGRQFITVVPEIEMPGHAQAAIAAYPELGNTGEQLEVGVKWGVYENVFNVKDSTISFLQDVLDEVMALFPGKFIHIGGDECPKVQWKADAFAQAKIKKLGLKDEHELQSWFIQQMDAYIASKGRRMIGWSEILEGGLAPGAALMVWLGNDGAEAAVGSGHDVVMAQNEFTYFDHYQVKDHSKEPHAIGGFLPIEKVYSYEPILPSFTPEQAKHVLGAQFQLWTEYIGDPKYLEYMAYPRACAMAEVMWSPRDGRDYADFSGRLPKELQRLALLDVNYRKPD